MDWLYYFCPTYSAIRFSGCSDRRLSFLHFHDCLSVVVYPLNPEKGHDPVPMGNRYGEARGIMEINFVFNIYSGASFTSRSNRMSLYVFKSGYTKVNSVNSLPVSFNPSIFLSTSVYLCILSSNNPVSCTFVAFALE